MKTATFQEFYFTMKKRTVYHGYYVRVNAKKLTEAIGIMDEKYSGKWHEVFPKEDFSPLTCPKGERDEFTITRKV